MVKIHYASLSPSISNQEYQKLCLLLPYWGLHINKEHKICGFESPREIGISGLGNGSILDLNQYLSHTGIRVRKTAHPECIISYKSDGTTQLSIRIHSVTYRFRPALSRPTQRLQEHIFKNVWLPKRDQPIHIFIDPHYSGNGPEWLSYLLIQYVTPPLEFKNLSSITLDDYQYFVSTYLMKINRDLASLQQLDGLNSEQSPGFPKKPTITPVIEQMGKKLLIDQIEVDNQDFLVVDDDMGDFEDRDVDSQLTIRPFRSGNHNEEKDPINPFKFGTSEQSIINPFRKKTTRD